MKAKSPFCKAAQHMGTHVLVCMLRMADHNDQDHFDPLHGVRWPACYRDCDESHLHGRYRLG